MQGIIRELLEFSARWAGKVSTLYPGKRGLKGTYVSVEPFQLFRYLDEQVFRYNLRELPNDGARFEHVASHIIGKRLTYAEVTVRRITKPGRLPRGKRKIS